jgi:hypothetical protein
MAVLRPLKLVIEIFPENHVEELRSLSAASEIGG